MSSQPLSPASPEFMGRVQELKPWLFEFEHQGVTFGGMRNRDFDKVALFQKVMKRIGAEPRRILELGSHEGSHSVQLASLPGVEQVVGLEARQGNIDRAAFIKSVYGLNNISFQMADLEQIDIRQFSGYDTVFCSGLLHHLSRPWRMLKDIGGVARYLYLDTHYCQQCPDERKGFKGRVVHQDVHDLQNGTVEEAFWLSFQDLVMQLANSGFVIHHIGDNRLKKNGPRVRIVAEKQGASCAWSRQPRAKPAPAV